MKIRRQIPSALSLLPFGLFHQALGSLPEWAKIRYLHGRMLPKLIEDDECEPRDDEIIRWVCHLV